MTDTMQITINSLAAIDDVIEYLRKLVDGSDRSEQIVDAIAHLDDLYEKIMKHMEGFRRSGGTDESELIALCDELDNAEVAVEMYRHFA